MVELLYLLHYEKHIFCATLQRHMFLPCFAKDVLKVDGGDCTLGHRSAFGVLMRFSSSPAGLLESYDSC